MSYTHRGLSDVVTTVLIILLVVVAVVAIGAYVRTSVDQTGKTLERESTCLINHIDATTCRYAMNTATNYNVTLNTKRTSDDSSVVSVATLKATVKATDGSIAPFDAPAGAIPGTNAAPASGVIANANTKQPAEVSLSAEFTLKNGNKVTCSSPAVSCSAA